MLPLLVVAAHVLCTKVAGFVLLFVEVTNQINRIQLPQAVTLFHIVAGMVVAIWTSYFHLVLSVLNQLSHFLQVRYYNSILVLPF